MQFPQFVSMQINSKYLYIIIVIAYGTIWQRHIHKFCKPNCTFSKSAIKSMNKNKAFRIFWYFLLEFFDSFFVRLVRNYTLIGYLNFSTRNLQLIIWIAKYLFITFVIVFRFFDIPSSVGSKENPLMFFCGHWSALAQRRSRVWLNSALFYTAPRLSLSGDSQNMCLLKILMWLKLSWLQIAWCLQHQIT